LNVLYPYQEVGADWLLEDPRRYLGDRMALGKTVQASAGARKLGLKRNVLAVVRAVAKENWQREWFKWGPKAELTTVSYADPRLHNGYYRGEDYELVILDEAHMAKNRAAARTLAALGVARQCERSWLLSGSPTPNYNPAELWAPIRALWPEIPEELGIGSYREWMDKFCVWFETKYGPKVTGVKNGHLLRPYLERIMLRRSVEDVAGDLPPVRVDVSWLPRDMEMARHIEGLEEVANGREWGPIYRRVVGEYKAPRVADIIKQELQDGEYQKIVIMAYHLGTLDRLQAMLRDFGVVRLDGSTSKDAQKLVDTFTNDAGTRVFLGQQTAAGESINLQAASEIVLVEPSHVPDDNAQALARIRPHLQGNRVRCRLFAVAGSKDEGIIENVAGKLRNRGEMGL
jgi:SNF2 family DNA or RNA helicase